MKIAERIVASQPSWVMRNGTVELALTRTGGHMAPVTFDRASRRPIQPYYLSPWHNEQLTIDDPVLRPLRGDFFCLPFGANAAAHRGEQHVCHGESATAAWTLVAATRSGPVTSMALSMKTRVRSGIVTKRLSLLEGHNAIYCSHILEGFSGKMPLGHHATLAVPEKAGALRIATSPMRFGMTPPVLIGDPTIGHYQSFAVDRKFTDLTRVPLMWRDDRWADATAYPARQGFTDLAAMFNKPSKTPAWTTAVNTVDGYMWFSLKDPAVLPTTAVWVSNRGRHSAPWNGRNRCLGLEEVCGYFAEGLAPSVRANSLTKMGVPTAVALSPKRPTVVNYIQGAVRVPRGFGRVAEAVFGPSEVTFRSISGKQVTVAVRHEYLRDGELS